MADPRKPEGENPLVHHETSDVNVRALLMFAVAMVVLAVVAHIGVALVLKGMRYQRDREAETPLTRVSGIGRQLPPQPLLQPFPPDQQAYPGADPSQVPHTSAYDMEQMRREEDSELSSYGWVDKQKGLVRIPISRAMEVMLTQGFPVRADGAKGAMAAPQESVAVSGGANSGQTIGRSAP